MRSAGLEQNVKGFGNVLVVEKGPRVASKQKASVAFAVAKINLNASGKHVVGVYDKAQDFWRKRGRLGSCCSGSEALALRLFYFR